MMRIRADGRGSYATACLSHDQPVTNRFALTEPAVPRTILILAAVAAVIYFALCLVLFLAQRSFIYFPQPKSVSSDKALTLNMDGERIAVSIRPSIGPDAVIYFGGNAEDVSRSLPTLAAAFPERSLYAMNYRGYGGSTGKPSETALIADALVLFERVHTDHPRVIVIGRSLGSGVAIHVASLRPVERLILVTPYDSLLKVAATQFRYFPLSWLMLDKFESWRYAPKITAPTRLIAAQDDEVIPLASTETLYQHLPQFLATMIIVPGVSHNTISESPEYIPLLRGE
jgi:pimeloyl-ACP methyl ester carboxylesterase